MEGIDWSWSAIDGTMTKAPPAADFQRRLFESEGVEFNISGRRATGEFPLPMENLYSVSNPVDGPGKRAKLPFLGISRA